jgi:hypothetical protein
MESEINLNQYHWQGMFLSLLSVYGNRLDLIRVSSFAFVSK